MNGGHDLGGMHGLGAIDAEPEEIEPVFHAEWERRMLALSLASAAHGRWNIDVSRHARERQHPADYLRNSYYENWLVGLETLLVESGLISANELATGKAEASAAPTLRATGPADMAATIYHLLGISPKTTIYDAVKRPHRLVIGQPIRAILS